MNANQKKFIKETKAEMKEHGVEIYLEKNSSYVELESGLKCAGYFDDEDGPMFACAMDKPFDDWFPVYIHEYGHFTQWRDKIPEWDGVTIDGLYYDNFLDKWIGENINFSKDKIERFMNASIAIEADCERRAYALIIERDLGLDLAKYAQTANSYVHFYNYIKLNRKWYTTGKSPYAIPEVYSQFNTTVDTEFPISHEYNDLFDKYCF